MYIYVVIGLTGIGPIRKISVLDWFCRIGTMKVLYCIDRFDHIKANKSKLINNGVYRQFKQYSKYIVAFQVRNKFY